jgi:hypothetical protein
VVSTVAWGGDFAHIYISMRGIFLPPEAEPPISSSNLSVGWRIGKHPCVLSGAEAAAIVSQAFS